MKIRCGSRYAAIWTLRAVALVLGAAVAGGALSTTPAVLAQEGEAQLFVAALKKDTPVMGLTATDFRVEEDGDRREVLRVEPATTRFDLALLVDDSMVATNNISHIRDALVSFVDAMAGNTISLIAFGDQRQTIVDYTRDVAPLRNAATLFSGFSQTSTYLLDAVEQTARDLARRQALRPAMVVVTTEGRGMQDMAIRGNVLSTPGGRSTPDASRDRDAKAVVEDLREYGVAMHAVALTKLQGAGFQDISRNDGLATITSGAGGFRWIQENRERERLLDKGPNDTGGRLYKVSSSSGMEERLQRIATELSKQYLVTYHRPPTEEAPEKIRVRVNGQRLTVRATPTKVYIPPAEVYVVGGIVDDETVYHHALDCEGLTGGLAAGAIPVPLAAIGSGGKACPFCPGAR